VFGLLIFVFIFAFFIFAAISSPHAASRARGRRRRCCREPADSRAIFIFILAFIPFAVAAILILVALFIIVFFFFTASSIIFIFIRFVVRDHCSLAGRCTAMQCTVLAPGRGSSTNGAQGRTVTLAIVRHHRSEHEPDRVPSFGRAWKRGAASAHRNTNPRSASA